MLNVSVTCDSACDLPQGLAEKRGIMVIPIGVSMGQDFRQDGVDITAPELAAYIERTGKTPRITAVPVGEYERRFRALTEQGREVVHIGVSSGLSSSYQNACIAAAMVGNVYVVDSRSLSTGAGHLALLAAELAEAELAGEEIADALNDMKQRLDVSFVTPNMASLRRSGICSPVSAFFSDSMRLRPELELSGGKLRPGRKYRGGVEKVVSAYVRGRLEGLANVQNDRIFITHCGIFRETLEHVVALVKELQPFDEVLVAEGGTVLAAWCGPCCLGLQFLRRKG